MARNDRFIRASIDESDKIMKGGTKEEQEGTQKKKTDVKYKNRKRSRRKGRWRKKNNKKEG